MEKYSSCVFSNMHITKSKLDKINNLLEKDNKSIFDYDSKNYSEALKENVFTNSSRKIYGTRWKRYYDGLRFACRRNYATS